MLNEDLGLTERKPCPDHRSTALTLEPHVGDAITVLAVSVRRQRGGDTVGLMRPVFRQGDTIGKWELLDFLGAGGNGEVWEASGDGGAVALKVVARKTETEPYKRFVREVEAAKSVGSMKGVLPVYEMHLPAAPSRRDPAWIADKFRLRSAPLARVLASPPVHPRAIARYVSMGTSHRVTVI